METKGKSKKTIIYMVMLFFFSVALFVKNYGQGMSVANTTALAFSYENGFGPHALLGSVYALLDRIFPAGIMNYPMAMRFAEMITVAQYAILFLFFYCCIRMVGEEHRDRMGILIFFYAIFAVSYYCGYDGFGAVDVCMLTVTLLAALGILRKRWNPLLILAPILGMLLQTEYIFAYFGIYLSLMYYVWSKEKDTLQKKKWQYGLIASAAVVAVLCICFLIVRGFGGGDLSGMELAAGALSQDGAVDAVLMDYKENGYHLGSGMWPNGGNLLELLLIMILFLPYAIFAGKFYSFVRKRAEKSGNQTCYRVILLGGLSVFPLFLLNHNYGKWAFAFLSYYAVVILALLAMGDEIVESVLCDMMEEIRLKHNWMILLVLYPVMFVPFSDINICGITRGLAEDIKYVLQAVGVM